MDFIKRYLDEYTLGGFALGFAFMGMVFSAWLFIPALALFILSLGVNQ